MFEQLEGGMIAFQKWKAANTLIDLSFCIALRLTV